MMSSFRRQFARFALASAVIISFLVTMATAAHQPDDNDLRPAIDASVVVTATGCRNTLGRGIGTFIEPHLVLTSAHTIAGATEITVTHRSWHAPASIVAFDPTNDLAVVAIDSAHASVMPLAAHSIEPSTLPVEGWIVVIRDNALVRQPVVLRRAVSINTEDIYVDQSVTRPGYELQGDIQLGDSGALVTVAGAGVGVVWSKSRTSSTRAWVIDPVAGGGLISTQLSDGLTDNVDPTRC